MDIPICDIILVFLSCPHKSITPHSFSHTSPPPSLPVVEIDLLAEHFRPGKPNYERLKVALTKNLPLKMDFLLAVGETVQLLPPTPAYVERAVMFYAADPCSRAESCVESLLNASRHVCVEAKHKHYTKVLCNSLYFLHNGIHILCNDI